MPLAKTGRLKRTRNGAVQLRRRFKHMETKLNSYLLAIMIPVLFLGLFCFFQHRKRIQSDAVWEKKYPRAAFGYCGKTLLFYENSHGNQIEFLDHNGHCYLWYPGNSIVLVGRWRTDGYGIYFKYGMNTFNPVTGLFGGRWQMCPIGAWSVSIVESVAGDVLDIKRRIPFVLKRDPPIRTIYDLKSPERD